MDQNNYALIFLQLFFSVIVGFNLGPIFNIYSAKRSQNQTFLLKTCANLLIQVILSRCRWNSIFSDSQRKSCPLAPSKASCKEELEMLGVDYFVSNSKDV